MPRIPTAPVASGSQAPQPRASASAARGQTALQASDSTQWRLAAAAFVLALLTVPLSMASRFWHFPFGLLGCLPGVICGHIALSRIQRVGSLRGRGLAVAALVCGYFFIGTTIIGVAVFLVARPMVERITASRDSAPVIETLPPVVEPSPVAPARPVVPPQRSVPSQPFPPQRQPLAEKPARIQRSFPLPGPQPQPPFQNSPPVRRTDPVLTTDPARVAIPQTAVTGKLGGQNFAITRANLQNGVLTLSQGSGFIADNQIVIFLFSGETDNLAGRVWHVPNRNADPTANNPHVHLRWRDGVRSNSEALTQDYVMRLEFGRRSGKLLPGKIYLELPQSYRTRLAGSFTAEIL